MSTNDKAEKKFTKKEEPTRTLWEQIEEGDIPRKLSSATEGLWQLADSTNEKYDAFEDSFTNDSAQNYTAIIAAVAICRMSLKKIEVAAKQHLAKEAAYHRQILEEIENLKVL